MSTTNYATIVVFDDTEPKFTFMTSSEEETVERILAIAFDSFTQRFKVQGDSAMYARGINVPKLSRDLKLSDVKHMNAMELVNFINNYNEQSFYFFMGSINNNLINFSIFNNDDVMII